MKKHFLFLATLVLGLGQLFADGVTFSLAELRATLPSGNTKVAVPYTWKVSPYHVTATIAKQDGTEGELSIANSTNFKNYTITVTVAGEGKLNGVTFTGTTSYLGNATASTGTYASGTWAPAEGTTPNSVTFTTTNNFPISKFVVDYTPDSGYTPDVPGTGFTEPFEATPVDSKASYTGNDPYIYDKTSLKFYALNTNGEYEEYGVVSEVNTLKVAGDAITEIESIKSTDNAYINLNYIPKANSKAVCTLIAEEGGDWKAIYGCGYHENGWKDRFCFFTTNATINLGGETGNRDAMRYNEKIVTVLDAAAGKMDIFEADGTTLIGTITDSPKTADCKTPLYVFAQNKDVPNGGKQTDCYNMLTTLFGLQLYEGETLVMDLVPAINGEGKGGLKDKLTGTFYGSANNGEFQLSADGQAMAGEAGITAYEGKIVIYNNHEYEYFNGSWVDRGEMAYQAVSEIGTDYKNLSKWNYPGSAYDATFGVNVFDGTTNTLNPYEGKGGWEPLSFKLTGLTKGESYRASFNYTGTAWSSWSSYTTLPFFVLDNENMPDNAFNNPSAALGYIALPNTETTNQPYSTVFTANHNYALLCIQFGVVDDGSHDPAFAFSFGNINVEKRVLPQAYNAIDWADPVKYTPLEYIEAISQARNNPYTLPYIPVTATEIDTKFQVYDTSTGWCGIFCARNTYAGSGISLYMNGNDRAHFGYFTGGTTGGGDNFAPFSLNTDYEVQADVTKLVVNGETYNTGNTVTNATTRQLSLFSNPEWDNPMRGRYYYCNISEAGETLYNFKPVMRHDGKFGFYDKASRIFVMPAQGKLDGYGYQKLTDQAYVTYTTETRIVIVGTTAQFLPDVQNLDGATFTWTSADETIATVAADGTVTGVKAGKVMITVTTDADNGWTAQYELTVSEPNYIRKDVNNVGYAVVTGGNGWGDSPVANLVDNDATTKFGCSGGGDAWAIIIASEPVAVQQYSFVTGGDTYGNPGRTPRDWKLEGSNDNQTWTVIDQQEQNYKAKTANKEQTVFTVNGTDTYKFFKFTAGNFNGGFQLGELWINEQAHTWGEPTETASTCTVEGKKVWECTDCKALKTERLPLAAHAYENGVCTVCNAKVAEPILLANGQANDYIVKFRHKTGAENDRNIEEGWNTADFDDSAWDELVMPIGTAGYGVQHTIWQNEYNTFWFRRNFYVENPAAITKLTLKALHDDDYAIYVNGTQIDEAGGWTNGTEWLELDVDPSLLVAGNNVVAVYIEQNWGGAYCDFYLEGKAGATVEVGDAGYATFVAPCDVDFTGAEVTPKAATFDGEYVQLADVTTVPAGTAVVVKAAEGTYTVPATTDAVLGATNELVAATADVTADGTQYILAKQGEEVGFAMATTGSTIAAGKGYLVINSPVKAFYGFDENATGINDIELAGENAPIYNVAGQRISKMQKGINIVGSKKILK
ncbi:MAG: Ig-like domain-containing protein [Bacteroidaceae bacterium]|nr:Ig-like domain-containing protein [Bacteroidaceae bacterium]